MDAERGVRLPVASLGSLVTGRRRELGKGAAVNYPVSWACALVRDGWCSSIRRGSHGG
jgi:hypothetical protein